MHDDIDSFVMAVKGREYYFNQMMQDVKALGLNPKILRGYENNFCNGRRDGILQCTKKYFTWLDDDDRYPNLGALEELYKIMETTNAPFAYSKEIEIDERGKLLDKVNYTKYSLKKLLNTSKTVHGLILVRRDLITDDILNECVNIKRFERCLFINIGHLNGGPRSTDKIGRYWRQHSFQGHRT